MSDGDALLRAILAHPGEDTPRLMYADWLDENGRAAQAAYIRWNCKPHFRHPFPRVSYRRWFAPWWEGETYRTHVMGTGDVPTLMLIRVHGGAGGSIHQMHVTRGFVGEVWLPAVTFMDRAEALFRAHPITAVRLTDREPYENLAWYQSGPGGNDRNCIPDQILARWRFLPNEIRRWRQIDRRWMYFQNVDDAQLTLSDLCVSYGRKLAGLPPLTAATRPAPRPRSARTGTASRPA